jgi:hypothetical protein
MINPQQLLRPPITAEYEPPDLALSAHFFHPNRPLFTLWHVDAMLTDPRVRFGLDLLRGPIITNAHFIVHTKNIALKTFLASQINRFWRTSIQTALRCMDYGFLGCEVLYRSVDNFLQFDRLKFLHPHNTRVVTVKGEFVGMDVARVGTVDSTVYVGRPKAFWTVHARDSHAWYGRSRLRGAFLAWNEIWSDHGYRDQRRVWFYKNAYAGPKVGYPPGSTPSEEAGEPPLDHRNVAQEIVDKMVTGTGITYPVIAAGPQGGWIIEDAKPISIPEGLMEYGDSLADEIWEGMGIPPEVARAEGTGAFAGRRVPQQAFYSVLQEIMQDIITDFDEQILKPLTFLNFGASQSYEIECFGLMRSEDQDEQGGIENPQAQSTADQGQGLSTGIMLPQIDKPLGSLGAISHFGNRLMFYGNVAR